MIFLTNICTNSTSTRILYIIKTIMNSFCIILPTIFIIMATISLAKVVISGKSDDFKENLGLILKKYIVAIFIFFLPNIVTYVFGDLGEFDVSALQCIENITIEDVENSGIVAKENNPSR